jgi:hypothetical protein
MRLSPTTPAVRPATWGFARLAPETRNAIYELVFRSPSALFVEAADGVSPGFRLSERSDQLQHNVVHALRALGLVDRQIRREARTLFYSSKRMLVLPYGYEYLPVFVHWLSRIGPECRAVLRTDLLRGIHVVRAFNRTRPTISGPPSELYEPAQADSADEYLALVELMHFGPRRVPQRHRSRGEPNASMRRFDLGGHNRVFV